MITAQDIREKTFEKAKIGGYDMATVDDFLEELADDITASQKENAVLKSKMKVLVDKIEEYRANEEALNMAIMSAQKLAVQIESEARQRANAMLADAERQVKARVGSIEEETALQERRLADAKAVTSKFFDNIRSLCNTQLKNIDAISSGLIPQEPAVSAAPAAPAAPAAAPNVDEAVRSIESSVAKAQPEPQMKLDLGKKKDAPAAPARGFDSTQPFSF